MRRIISAGLVAALAACGDSRSQTARLEAASAMPHLGAVAKPRETRVYGIPIHVIDTSWVAATVLARSAAVADSGNQALADASTRESYLDGDFDRDGVRERAVVGVYRDRAGENGRFVLILTRQGNRWQKAFAASVAGRGDVTFLSRSASDTVVWHDCAQCDSAAARVFWDGGQYAIRWAVD